MKILGNIPPIFKNFYFCVGFIFFIWMLFFDSNDLINRFHLSDQLDELENEVSYYEKKIVEAESERASLMTDKEKLEKFARESYLMKKPSEEVFVIEELQ